MPAACATLLALAAWCALALPAMLFRALGLIPPQLPPLDLAGKHVLVTGGSQGLGLALAEGCAARGARVSVLARSAAPLQLARVRIQAVSAPGHTAVAVSADVTDDAATLAAVAEAVAAQGGRAVDVLIAAAGAAEPGYFLEQPAALFERQMRLNYLGTVHAIQAVLPAMVQRPPGGGGAAAGADCRLVLVGSGASAIAFLGYAAYAPTKFAVKVVVQRRAGEGRTAMQHGGPGRPSHVDGGGMEGEWSGRLPVEPPAAAPVRNCRSARSPWLTASSSSHAHVARHAPVPPRRALPRRYATSYAAVASPSTSPTRRTRPRTASSASSSPSPPRTSPCSRSISTAQHKSYAPRATRDPRRATRDAQRTAMRRAQGASAG
jgi:NAD(P)-dependent dehydrogenase (short-subunit alcohol dehydrogenase family)